MASDPQVYNIEIRLDHTGTKEQAIEQAKFCAALVGGYVTTICDEDWNEI